MITAYHILLLIIIVQKDEVYLNLVLEFVPETVYKVTRHYSKAKQTIPMLFIKVSNETRTMLWCGLKPFDMVMNPCMTLVWLYVVVVLAAC